MRLEATERLNLGLSAGAVAASYALEGPHFAASLALGAALEAVNFRALHSCARALFGGIVAGGSAWVGVLGARMGLLGAGVVASLVFGAHPVGLLVGLSLVMPATVIAAIANRPPVLPVAPHDALAPDDPSWDRYSVWQAKEVEPDPGGDEDSA